MKKSSIYKKEYYPTLKIDKTKQEAKDDAINEEFENKRWQLNLYSDEF